MPLNASNRLNLDPPTGRTVVQFTIRPSSRAVAEGWNTQIQRAKSTNPSTDAITEVATVPASRRVVNDRGVPSTTGGHFWRARHVKEGSTAGPWFDWVGGGPRTGPGGPVPTDLPSIHDEDDWTRLRQEQTLTKGKLANSTGKRFMDLESTGTNDFIHAEDGSGKVTVSIQADGDADFAGTVSSSKLTADVVQQGSSNRNITLEALPIGPGSTDSFVTFNKSTGTVSRITSSTRVFTFQNSVSGDFLRLASSTDTKLFSGRSVTVETGSSDVVVDSGRDVTMQPSGFVNFEGGNLSTSATTGLGPDRYLTVNTTAGLRKIPLFQT